MPRGTRRADAEIGARSARLDGDLRKARGKFRRWGKDTSRDVQKSFSGLKRNMATIAGFGGIAVFGEMARSAYNFEKRLFRLRIQGGKNAEWMGRMRKQVRSVSNETGVAADELLGGAEAYVTLTGDANGAAASLATFARIAQASGSDMNDIATSAAALRDNMAIDPKDFEKAFSGMLTQGKAGAVELKDMAQLLASLTAKFPQFGKTGTAGLAELGAMLQVGKKGFGTAQEAATGFEGAMVALTKNAARFQEHGVKVFDKGPKGVKKFRSVAQIFDAISKSKLAKDPTLLAKAFGRDEGRQFYEMWVKNRALFEDLNKAAKESSAVADDYKLYKESEFGKMERAWQRMKNSIAEVFTPERIEKFGAVMSKVADIVGFLADHLVEIGVAIASYKGLNFASGMFGGAGAAAGGGGGGGGAGGLGGGAGGRGRRGRKGMRKGDYSGFGEKRGDVRRGQYNDAPKTRMGAGEMLGKVANATIMAQAAYIGGKAIEEYANSEKRAEERQSASQAGFDQIVKMLTTSVRSKGMSPEAVAIASQLVKEGMALGFVNNQGQISSTPASQGAGAQAYRENRSGLGKAADAAAGTTQSMIALEQQRIGEENRAALQMALALAQQAKQPQKVEVTVTVDQQGLLKAEETKQRKKRARGAR